MDRISIDKDLARILPNRYSPVAITDADGKILGHYVPKLTWDDVAPESNGSPSDAELLELSQKAGKRYTTLEVVAHLRSLG